MSFAARYSDAAAKPREPDDDRKAAAGWRLDDLQTIADGPEDDGAMIDKRPLSGVCRLSHGGVFGALAVNGSTPSNNAMGKGGQDGLVAAQRDCANGAAAAAESAERDWGRDTV